MKKHIILTLLIIFFISFVNAQWQLISTPVYSDPPPPLWECYCYYNGDIATNSTMYWVHRVGCQGGGSSYYSYYKIYKTTDGGDSWNLKVNSYYIDIINYIDIDFISQDTGYFVDHEFNQSIIYRTANGMNTLEGCIYSPTTVFKESEMASYNEIYYIDCFNKFYSLENDTFKVRYNFPPSLYVYYSKIEVTESNLIYLACNNESVIITSHNLILKSTDIGLSWDTSYMDSSAFIKEIKFISDSIGFAVGDSGTIIKTCDAGQSWAVKLTGLTSTLLSIDYLDNLTWIATGNSGIILITTDGGETWETLDSPTNNAILKTKIPETNGIVFIQTENHIWKANIFDLITSINSNPDLLNLIAIYPNPAKDQFTLVTKSPKLINAHAEFYNLLGAKIYSNTIEQEKEVIDCSTFPKGIYLVKIVNQGESAIQKLVVQ